MYVYVYMYICTAQKQAKATDGALTFIPRQITYTYTFVYLQIMTYTHAHICVCTCYICIYTCHSDGRALLLVLSHLVPNIVEAVLFKHKRVPDQDTGVSDLGVGGGLEEEIAARVCAGSCKSLGSKCQNVFLVLEICSRVVSLPTNSRCVHISMYVCMYVCL